MSDYSDGYSDDDRKPASWAPTNSIYTPTDAGFNPMIDEPQGTLISVQCEPFDFEEYEIYNFIESTVRIDLYELSMFKTLDGKPNGITVAQFSEPVQLSRLKRLHGKKFKGHPVEVRLYTNNLAFQKFCRSVAELRLREINIETSFPPPIIYIANFSGDSQELRKLLKPCGTISFIREYETKNFRYYTMSFTTEAASKVACNAYNGFQYKGENMIVVPLYPNAAERSFAVHHVINPELLRREIENFGPIESFKHLRDDICFVLMQKTEDAKAACVLLNNRIFNETQIKTNFIDLYFFNYGNINI